jgi:hypothetical protein
MEPTLDHITDAVRPQFIWAKSNTTLFHTHPKHSCGKRTLGLTVLAGIALMFGYGMEEIALHTGAKEVDTLKHIKFFKQQMQLYYSGCKDDITVMCHRKAIMVLGYLRINYLGKDRIKLSDLNH